MICFRIEKELKQVTASPIEGTEASLRGKDPAKVRVANECDRLYCEQSFFSQQMSQTHLFFGEQQPFFPTSVFVFQISEMWNIDFFSSACHLFSSDGIVFLFALRLLLSKFFVCNRFES